MIPRRRNKLRILGMSLFFRLEIAVRVVVKRWKRAVFE